jgi:amino acid transporter
MTDDVFDSLGADWRKVQPDQAAIAERHATHRRRVRRRIAINYIATAIIAVTFAAMAWLAMTRHDALYNVATLAFLAALPVCAIGLAVSRHESAICYDATPSGHLRAMQRWLDSEYRLLLTARFVSGILAVSVISALGLDLGGYAPTGITIVLTSTWGTMAALVWWWQSRRGGRLRREKARVDKMLAEMDAAEGEADKGSTAR